MAAFARFFRLERWLNRRALSPFENQFREVLQSMEPEEFAEVLLLGAHVVNILESVRVERYGRNVPSAEAGQ